MRNLKKILALVLAMVMTFSVMATANAFTDDAAIDADYNEAVEVLAALKVFEGYEDGSFKPQGKITRAEVAAIIYRVVTGDVKDTQVGIYADYNKFDDVKSTAWYAGYVNFCANAEYIKGYGDGNFGPNDNVTGYQALAMILRAIGYDKNGEFTGSNWQVQTAAVGKKLGITDNVTAGTLGTAATREVVAEILFQTIANATQVDYTVAFGYTTYGNNTLGWDTFKLQPVGDTNDVWGRPGFQWNANGKKLVVVAETPIVTYTTAVTECDVAKAVGLKADTTYDLYVNGAIKSNLPVQLKDTVDTLGAQGRITEVYEDEIVMIDTFLAKVTATTDAKFDKNGHQIAPYTITMTVYDDANGHTVVLTDEDAAFGYTAGDYVLVNAYTATGDRDGAGLVAKYDTNYAVYGEIVGLAESVVGAQSVIWYNAEKHTVNGTTYDDACEFNKNDANTTTVNYTWYFDQFGNLIGAFEIATKYDYAVLTKLWWAGDAATGLGKAMGTLKYMDGTENTVEIAKIGGKTTTYAIDANYGIVGENFQVATYIGTNAAQDGLYGWIDGNLMRVYTNANGAVELDVVKNAAGAHTEITAKVYNKNGYIGNKALKVDTTTMFLVGTPNSAGVYSYTTYTGINEIPTFSAKDAIVDYVLGSNGVAKYVYIIGTPDSASTTDHVLITNTGYTANLKTAGGVSYWEVNLYTLEGLVTVKTKTEAVLNELTNPANVNCLYYLTYTDGYATAFRKVTNTPVNYSSDKYDALVVNATYANDVVEADTSYGADYRWNVTESTIVVGELAADMTDKIVYVLYDKAMNVQKIYIIDAPATSVDPEVSEPTKGVVNYVVTMYLPDGTTKTLSAKWTGTGSFEAGSQSFATIAPVHFPELTAGNWTVLVDETGALEVKAGYAYTMNYIINANNN